MEKYDIIKEIPPNIEELKRKSNNKSSWKDRQCAVEVLKLYDCQQSRDILTRMALHDPVFKVKSVAFLAAQKMGIEKGGKPISLRKKPKGNLIPHISKKIEIVRNALPGEYSLGDFKTKFQCMYPEIYDTYEGEKDGLFDSWLNNVIKSLPNR